MSYTEWKDKVSDFKKVDVRGVAGNFFQGIEEAEQIVTSQPEPQRMLRKRSQGSQVQIHMRSRRHRSTQMLI